MRPGLAGGRRAARPDPRALRERFAEDVRVGLTRPGQKELPSKYLYDTVGSALFEVICLLPEYGLHRAGSRLLARHAETIATLADTSLVAELGSGNARNTRWILEAMSRRQSVTYCPIDISGAALAEAERELDRFDRISVVGFEREYLEGLGEVVRRRPLGQRLLVLFLGGTIGNFDRPAADRFLSGVREVLTREDLLLVSTDLVKPADVLIAAYDDPAGVTAAFDLNLLARVNRELDGTFDLSAFRHRARWNAAERRIEMHLEALADLTARVDAADLEVSLRAGETIWTESSHKFRLEEIPQLAERTGFRCEGRWVDAEWPFAQNLFVAV
jgi:L-histidine N-alpha-methyltransferase